MDWFELIARACLFVFALYLILLAFKLLRWIFRSALSGARNLGQLPQKAGSAAASAVDVAKTVKNGFVDGYKGKR